MRSILSSSLRRGRNAALAVMAMAATALSAHATPITVINGNFSATTNGYGQLGYNTNVTGWSGAGYNFVFNGAAGAASGAPGSYGNLQLWAPGNGTPNGFINSPDGGNFIGMDGAFQQVALTQTISGLTKGASVTVSFYFAGAQQKGFDGPTTEQFMVSLGNQNIYTEALSDPNHGFTGWKSESLTFTAAGPSEVLSFFAIGTPSGEPPFSLLDGVTVDQTVAPVPEPGSLALLGTELADLSNFIRSRFSK